MARTHFTVGIPTGPVSVNHPVDTAGTRAITLFQLRQPLFGVFQLLFKKRKENRGGVQFHRVWGRLTSLVLPYWSDVVTTFRVGQRPIGDCETRRRSDIRLRPLDIAPGGHCFPLLI